MSLYEKLRSLVGSSPTFLSHPPPRWIPIPGRTRRSRRVYGAFMLGAKCAKAADRRGGTVTLRGGLTRKRKYRRAFLDGVRFQHEAAEVTDLGLSVVIQVPTRKRQTHPDRVREGRA